MRKLSTRSALVSLFGAWLALSGPAAHSQGQDIEELTKRAENGEITAQFQLADYYYKGDEERAPDYPKAARWYTKLAENSVGDAQLTLGLMYIKGQGVEKNDTVGVKWLTKAAEQKSAAAQYLVGLAHEEGHGVKQNDLQAYVWYEIAASMDHKFAIEGRERISAKLTKAQIKEGDALATKWWLDHHH